MICEGGFTIDLDGNNCCKTKNCKTCNLDGKNCDECATVDGVDYFLNKLSDGLVHCVSNCPVGMYKNYTDKRTCEFCQLKNCY